MSAKRQQKILLVDDMAIVIEIIKSYLNDLSDDFHYVITDNGRDACKLALSEQPDLIIMDWEMPKMTGIEALEILKKHQRTAHIPVVILSGFSDELSIQRVMDLGAEFTLAKPIVDRDLKEKVTDLLSIGIKSL